MLMLLHCMASEVRVVHLLLLLCIPCYCTFYALLLHCMASEVGVVHFKCATVILLLKLVHLLLLHFVCWCYCIVWHQSLVWYTYCYCTWYTCCWCYCTVWHQRLVWYTPYIRPLCDCYCAPHSLTMPQSPSLLSSRLLLFLYHIYVRYKYQNMDMKYLRSPQFPSISGLLWFLIFIPFFSLGFSMPSSTYLFTPVK